jgi:hypothetical protein
MADQNKERQWGAQKVPQWLTPRQAWPLVTQAVPKLFGDALRLARRDPEGRQH